MVSEIPVAKRRADAPFAADVIYAHRDVELRNAELAATTACLLRAWKTDRCNAGARDSRASPGRVGDSQMPFVARVVGNSDAARSVVALLLGGRGRVTAVGCLLSHRRTYATMFAATVEDLALLRHLRCRVFRRTPPDCGWLPSNQRLGEACGGATDGQTGRYGVFTVSKCESFLLRQLGVSTGRWGGNLGFKAREVGKRPNAAFLGVKNKSTARKPFVSAALRTAQVALTGPSRPPPRCGHRHRTGLGVRRRRSADKCARFVAAPPSWYPGSLRMAIRRGRSRLSAIAHCRTVGLGDRGRKDRAAEGTRIARPYGGRGTGGRQGWDSEQK